VVDAEFHTFKASLNILDKRQVQNHSCKKSTEQNESVLLQIGNSS